MKTLNAIPSFQLFWGETVYAITLVIEDFIYYIAEFPPNVVWGFVPLNQRFAKYKFCGNFVSFLQSVLDFRER